MNTTFTKVYNDDLTNVDLSPSQRITYQVLCSFDYDNDCEVHPTEQTIANLVGLSERQIRRILKVLQEKEYITIKTIKNFAYKTSKNVYFLVKKFSNLAAEAFKKLSTDTGHECPQNTGHPCPSDNITLDKIDDDIETINIINNLKKTEGEDIVKAALEKIKDKTIKRNGFRTYLLKTIATIKSQNKIKDNQYSYSKPKGSTFSYSEQRDYNKCYAGGYSQLEKDLRAAHGF